MESGLLYTFSTIAQAPGRAFALLAAFVLYRFGSLDSLMSEDSHNLMGVFVDPAELERAARLRVLSRYPALIAAIDENIADRLRRNEVHPFNAEHAAILVRLKSSVRQRRQILVSLLWALVATGVEMIGSVAAIPYAHEWSANSCLSRLVMRIGV
jgi:hypothetical protein